MPDAEVYAAAEQAHGVLELLGAGPMCDMLAGYVRALADAYVAWEQLERMACEGCVHFTPDSINPPAGIGDCTKGNGMFYPMEKHRCRDRLSK